MSVLVTGSLAIDSIYFHPGKFSDVMSNSPNLSVSLFTTRYEVRFGGTAGNIAYNLAQLGVPKVDLAANMGRDEPQYVKHLATNKVNVDLINYEDLPTAQCVLFTDVQGAQINSFYPGAMSRSYPKDWLNNSRYRVGIIAANEPNEMADWAVKMEPSCEHVIFDPGQAIHGMTGAQLLTCLDHSKYLILNEHEMSVLTSKIDSKVVMDDRTVIVTRGSRGSDITIDGRNTHIPAVAIDPTKVVDPTGAGDAYRSGLIHGILEGSIEAGCKLGSIVAAVKVQHYGGQSHKLSNFRPT